MNPQLLYWTTTTFIALMLLLSAASYIYSQPTIEGVRALGFPDFFRIQLAILKITAAIIIIVPGLPLMIKEWAYAGIGLFLLTAFLAHFVHKDPIWLNLLNIFFFIVLILSRMFYLKTMS